MEEVEVVEKVPHTLSQKIRNFLEKIPPILPVLTLLVFVLFAQTIFQERQETRSGAAGEECVYAFNNSSICNSYCGRHEIQKGKNSGKTCQQNSRGKWGCCSSTPTPVSTCGPCAQFSPPAPDFCKTGTIVSLGVDKCGCPLPPICKILTPTPTPSNCVQLTPPLPGTTCSLYLDYTSCANSICPQRGGSCTQLVEPICRAEQAKYSCCYKTPNQTITPTPIPICNSVSTGASCISNSGCKTLGCNQEICGGSTETLSSTCITCTSPSKLGYACGCNKNKCSWGK